MDLAMTALEAAGETGLTARELAAVAHMPIGTASARLTVMKNEGLIGHNSPRYFAIHSRAEDNNLDQQA